MRCSAQTECIKSLIKLKRQEEVIEKRLDYFLDNMKLEPEILRVVKNEQCSRTFERRILSNLLRTEMIDIANCLREIKSLMNDIQEGRKIDVDNFKEKLLSLANKIREFKKDSTLETLTTEQNELEQDIHVFSLALTKYESRASTEFKKSTKSVVMNSHNDYKGMSGDFDALIAKTGHTQNWTEADHLFFLKVRKNCQTVSSLVAEIRKKCPDLTVERIVNHEAWYKIYLDLREKQKKTIREWRVKRDLQKREKIEEKSYSDKKHGESDEKKSINENAAKQSDLKVIASKSNETIRKMRNKAVACEKRELLKQWRADREKVLSSEIERSRTETESRKAWKESRRLARANAIKAAVLAHREKKMENLTSSSTTSVTDLERNTSKSEVVKFIKCFRHKDEEFLKRRTALLEKKKQRPNGIICHKIHSRSNIDQSTLLNPTKVWLQKCKAINESHPEVLSQQVSSYVKYIPKLGTCNWRNKESASRQIL